MTARADLRRLERGVLGAPMVPPARIASWANVLRRRVRGIHRSTAPPPLQIIETLFASFDAHVLRVFVEIDLPDLLDGPSTLDELADRTGCDAAHLDRLLRFAASRSLVGFDRKGRFKPNGVTTALRTDAAAPWRGWVRFATSDWFDAAWRQLGPALKPDAGPAFDLAHGTDFFNFTTTIDPSAGQAFDEAMAAGAMLQGIGLARTLDWEDVHSVCDVGGGNGATLDLLQRYEPHLQATLFDLPAVVDRATYGAEPCSDPKRWAVGGSFFDALPPGHDRYLLLAIVHDWDDARAIEILSNTRQAMGAKGEAIVVETIASEDPCDDFAAVSDLLMFVVATGRERTEEQYRDLFACAGLRVGEKHLLPTGATAFVLRPR